MAQALRAANGRRGISAAILRVTEGRLRTILRNYADLVTRWPIKRPHLKVIDPRELARALRVSQGHRGHAAKILGIHPESLSKRLREHQDLMKHWPVTTGRPVGFSK